MRRHTDAYERKRVNADRLLDTPGVDATRIADETRKARILQIDRLHSIWSPAIRDCLNALGKKAWGLGMYEIVEDMMDPDACWREYQVKGLEWHERTERLQVRNQDDWCECEYRLGYRLRLEAKDDHFTLGNSPVTRDSLKQWSLDVLNEDRPQSVEEHLIRFY